MDSGGPLSFSLSTPFSSPTSGGTDSSTPGGTSTAASGTETVGATSSTASTSLDTQSEVPSSTPTGGITTTGTSSLTPSLTSRTSSTDSFTSTSSGPAFSSVLATSSTVVSSAQSTAVPFSMAAVTSTSSLTSASFTPSVDTSTSATEATPPTSTTDRSSESSSLGAITTSETPTVTTTIEISETLYTTASSLTSPAYIPQPSMYTMISTLPGGAGTTTITVTSSGVLSTAGGADAVGSNTSPGTITAVVLGLVGAGVIVALWIFCARRRYRKRERDAALLDSSRHLGPLEGEFLDDEELQHLRQAAGSGGPPVMEERYANLLAALHTKPGTGASTDGVYGSQRDANGESDVDVARTSSPTLPFHALPSNDDGSHIMSLSPPPAAVLSSRLRASSSSSPNVDLMAGPRRKNSPGPDAAAWLGGHVAPSCASHYAHSQTLGSGSGSCSVDALMQTRTGSEEPLLDAGTPSYAQPPGGNKLGLGSAFGSADGSVYSPSSHYDARSRTLSGSGSYAHTRSMTSSSIDILRSMSSQGALSSSHADRGFGSGGVGSVPSDSMGRKKYRHAPSSFKAWKERGSSVRSKDEGKDHKRSTESSSNMPVSTSGSGDEGKGRSSPAHGVRGLLDRLRRVGHTPSPVASSRALPTTPTKGSKEFDVERTAGKGSSEVRPPTPVPIQAPVPTSPRSYVVFNPNPYPPSPLLGTNSPSTSVPQLGDNNDILHDPLRAPTFPYATMPSPAPTEASRLPEGLLHPRLQVEGRSVTSLRDFEDYMRPISGRVNNRLYSTTTFGTADYSESTPVHQARDELPGEPTDSGPRES